MLMINSHLGEIVSLLTAVCWTGTALAFQQASRKAGSLSVNIIRLLIAFAIYAVISYFVRGLVFPTDATAFNWIWLSISGLIGFVFGDYFLFKSYEHISARISMLIFSLSPPFAAIISWFILDETMNLKSILAMIVTLGGIVLVVTEKKKLDERKEGKRNNLKFSFPIKGLVFALLGTIGQSTGLVLSKYGMGDYNVFAATQIRIITGTVGFVILISLIKRWPKVKEAATNKSAMKFITIGAIFGPFIGVYLSLLAVKHTTVGIASTIMAIIPVLIIPPAMILYKEKVSLKEIIGALITVSGVILFFV
ncbi:MAG: DMT family transporter [Salinivirgaceae bacterium]|nr:DMT family transporter [Salinivirgaceae bacterium]